MKIYKATRQILHNSKLFAIGEELIGLDENAAASLSACGAVEMIEASEEADKKKTPAK